MDWVKIQEGLRLWVAHYLGIATAVVCWEGETRGMGAELVAELSILAAPGIGQDERRQVPIGDGETFTTESLGNRSITVRVDLQSHNAMPGHTALFHADGLRNKLQTDTSRAMLREAGLGIQGVLQCQPLPSRMSDGHMLSRAVLDIRFNGASCVQDAAVQSTIETVGIGGQIGVDDEADTLEIPEELFPV